jgi:hypothetical protein
MTATAQTNAPAPGSPKVRAAGGAKAIPAIECNDPDTMAACKSFKGLVDARDQGLLAQVLGTSEFRRHTSFVCLRPKADFFSIVNLDIPEPTAYQPSSFNTDEKFAHDTDSIRRNASTRKLLDDFKKDREESKKNAENQGFMDFSNPPAISKFTKDRWYEDHSKVFIYSPGIVEDYRYQDGINFGPAEDWGEWSMLASIKDDKQNDPTTWFTGGYAWIERYNSQHGNQSAKDDDPKHGHILVDTSSILVHYKYGNGSGDTVDYTMRINLLTGRFVESMSSPGSANRASGTCMIFK